MTRFSFVTLAAGSLAGMAAVVPLRVDAALCRTRHGALVVRNACRHKETSVDLPKGDPGTQGASQPRLRAFDATGTPLPGYVAGTGAVVIPRGTRAVRVRAGIDGFENSREFYFEASNCGGQRLVQDEGLLVEVVPVLGGVAYYAGDPVQDHAILSVSSAESASSCMDAGGTYDVATGFCCTNGTQSVRAGPATAIDLTAFVPPFRVELDR